MRLARLLIGGGVAALMLPAGAWAQSESRLSADATVTAGFSNNPFSTAGTTDTGAAVVTFDIAPRYVLLTPRSTITFSADANVQQYLRQYGHNDSYSGAVDYRGRASERLTTHFNIEVASAVLGTFSNAFPFAGSGGVTGIDTTGVVAGATTNPAATTVATIPNTISPLSQYSDVGLFGLRNRRRLGRVGGDLALAWSTRDTLTASAYGEVARYSNLRSGDYEAFGGSLGYSRRLSSRVSVGLSGSASSYTYRNSVGDSRVYSLQATASAQLSERWTADGALGASFVDSDSAGSTRSTSLSGNLNLCRRYPASSLCLQLARQVSPTGLAGTQYVSSAALSWNRQLDLRQGISLGVNYSKVGGGNRLFAGTLPLETEYLQASAGYNRRLGDRLRFVVSANYRSLLNDAVHRPADYGGQIGLTYRFGDRG